MAGAARVVARSAPHERLARDWALVLTAVGVGCEVERRGREWDLVVAADDAERAAEALAAYDAEAVPGRPAPAPAAAYGRTWAGLVLAMLLVLGARLTGTRAMGSALFRAGEAHAGSILNGEPWRTVTALTLHADVTHLVSNLVSGALVATAVSAAVGPGVGAWLLLLAGAAGNGLTAWMHGGGHRAVGASTAVFGGIGVLVGLAIVRRTRRAWVPVAAGLALLGLLGTSEHADLLAHFFGFAAGVAAGTGVAPLPLLRSRPAQWVLALAALGAVGGCWLLAVEHPPRR
jgi:membrane associated rhomboid family serine protease